MKHLYRIIIAEDDRLAGKLLQMIMIGLYPLGHVSLVLNGQEALQVYEQSGADLMILDKNMPFIDGLELTRTLRARGVPIPIIVMSGDPAIEAEAKKAGATLFVAKPGVYSQLPRLLPNLLVPQY
ncbi:MAG TPA: response regulator [Anaerolineae bacterium]|nr:response regulator [Anaerolineae bacterium]